MSVIAGNSNCYCVIGYYNYYVGLCNYIAYFVRNLCFSSLVASFVTDEAVTHTVVNELHLRCRNRATRAAASHGEPFTSA